MIPIASSDRVILELAQATAYQRIPDFSLTSSGRAQGFFAALSVLTDRALLFFLGEFNERVLGLSRTKPNTAALNRLKWISTGS